jgi:hypothetical protein
VECASIEITSFINWDKTEIIYVNGDERYCEGMVTHGIKKIPAKPTDSVLYISL